MSNYPQLLISGCMNLLPRESKISGIYAISGLAPSSFETPIYVGSTEDLTFRIERQHIPKLKNKKHINSPLQNYCNHNGIENIVFLCLELCNYEDLLMVEQKYIDYYGVADDKKSFNIAKIAGKPKTRKGMKSSPETIKKISEANKGEKCYRWGKKCSEEHKAKMSKLLTGRKQKQEDIDKKSYKFSLIDKDGKIVNGFNLKKFADENNLHSSHLCCVMVGKRKSHKGYTRNFLWDHMVENKGIRKPTS